MNNHVNFYSEAELYDIAFDFKDIQKECDFLSEIYLKYKTKKVESFLDIGCGPGLHAVEFGLRLENSLGIDLSQEMVDYANKKSQKMKSKAKFLKADMTNFHLQQKVDLAGIFMDSTAYLLTNDDVINHLKSVAENLNAGGIYVLEMSHPRDMFSVGKSTDTEWQIDKDNLKVSMKWGDKNDYFNPISQVTNTSVILSCERNGKKRFIKDKAQQRAFTTNEFLALVKASDAFEVKEIFGAMDFNIPFSNEKNAWRMIPVLQKK